MKPLRKILNDCKSDKASKHFYDSVYEHYFQPIRDLPLNFLEVGIFNGNSIKAWLEYFPNATIYGIDLFDRVRPDDIEILKDPRVKWLESDSTVSTLTSMVLESWPNVTFDVIIDDGLHTPEANMKTFQSLMPLLSKTGVYFIEDVFPFHVMKPREKENPWIKKHNKDLNDYKFSELLKALKAYDYVLHDNRAISKQPDSTIFRVKYK